MKRGKLLDTKAIEDAKSGNSLAHMKTPPVVV